MKLLPACLAGLFTLAAGAGDDRAGAYVLQFSGVIGGSERIQVEAHRAVWTHLAWDFPRTPVLFNGMAWDPSRNPVLSTGDARLVPDDMGNYQALLNLKKGRDIAVAEIRDGHLFIHLNDTPKKSDLYEFEVVLKPKAPPKASPRAALTIQARIDGSERIRISKTEAKWIHKYWKSPELVSMNGVAWNPTMHSVLPNTGATIFLAPDVDLSTARLVQFAGRDTATLQQGDGFVEIVLADNPNDADDYNLTLAFGSEGPPPAPAERDLLSAEGAGPLVQTQVVGGNLRVIWSAKLTGYVLETSTDLSPGSWQVVSDGIALTGGENQFEMPMNEPRRFFRLRKL